MEDFNDIFEDCTSQGTKIPKEEYLTEGQNIVIDQGQNIVAGYTDREDGIFEDVPAIIFGDHTRIVKYVDRPFYLGADGVKLLKAKKENANYKYLFYALRNARIPDTGYNRHFKWLKEVKIEYPCLDKQAEVVEILDKLSWIINARKEEQVSLDNLIKARFVELFGDPIINSEKLPTMPMTDVCEIIDGDRGKNYPTTDEFSDEGYCLFLNAKNVTASGFNFDNCMFVSKEKDEALRKGKLSRGDVVLTTRGTLGNLAFYTDEIPFENVRINSGMVILRMKQDVIDEVYFIEQFKMQLGDIKKKIASGSAQPQLPISTMNKIQVLIPDIERQKDFSEFIKQVDKSKVAVQKALDETQKLFNSLMQEYFG
ncbi:MAG: restriction endonuclease subunit S [Lachnospiraceae bacterium]|nr:restriction endonuclease subunit S [Lachnospiraceae bacterium]